MNIKNHLHDFIENRKRSEESLVAQFVRENKALTVDDIALTERRTKNEHVIEYAWQTKPLEKSNE